MTDTRPIPLTCGGTAYHEAGDVWLCDQCYAPVPNGTGMPSLCQALHDAGGLLP